MVEHGFTDCFAKGERRDNYFEFLNRGIVQSTAPSEVITCRGDNPVKYPYPYCVNTSWKYKKATKKEDRDFQWDNWVLDFNRTVARSDEHIWKPTSPQKFEEDFEIIDCVHFNDKETLERGQNARQKLVRLL